MDGVMKVGPFGVAPESETPGWTHRRIKCVLPGDSLSVKAGSFLTVEMRDRQTQTYRHRHSDLNTDGGCTYAGIQEIEGDWSALSAGRGGQG